MSQKDDYNNVLNDMFEDENISIEKRQKLNLLRNMLNNIESNSELESNQALTKNSSRIYTPNGSIVEYAQYKENKLTADKIESFHTSVLKKYPTLTEADYISPVSSAYNCHSYAWYQQDVKLNNFWISLPTSYIDDFSYVEVIPFAQVIFFVIGHIELNWLVVLQEKTILYRILQLYYLEVLI